jgi:hypothetical protein
VDRRCGSLDGGEFVITEAERHGRAAPMGARPSEPRGLRLQEADEEMVEFGA